MPQESSPYEFLDTGNFTDVGRFHAKFDLPTTDPYNSKPKEVDEELLQFRMKFLLEEVLEFIEAAGYRVEVSDPDHGVTLGPMKGATRDYAKMFDALIDEVYVALGTAHFFGFPWQRGWNLVQKANMSKIRAVKSEDSARGGTWDVIKPSGWTAPDIEGLLNYYGWDQQ